MESVLPSLFRLKTTDRLSTTYTGANATIVNQTVAQVIEDQLKGVEDMSYMSSASSRCR